MMRSLFAGVSALRNHQVKMDVIGNNIANVNTVGFKASAVNFKEMINQTIRSASGPQGSRGGVNPMEVGLGVDLGSITLEQTQGNLQTTGNQTDLAIQGNGFFILGNGSERFYSRSGMFDVDRSGSLLSSATGLKVLGWEANGDGKIDPTQELVPVRVPKDSTIGPSATTTIEYTGNLDVRESPALAYNPEAMTVKADDGSVAQVEVTVEPVDGAFNRFRWSLETDNGTWTAAAGQSTSNGGTTLAGTVDLDATGAVAQSTGAFTLTYPGGDTVSFTPPQVGAAEGGGFQWQSVSGGNSGSTAGEYAPVERVTTIRVFDSLGKRHDVVTTIRKAAATDRWEWEARDEDGNLLNAGGTPGTLTFNSAGKVVSQSGHIQFDPDGPTVGAEQLSISPDFSGVTQFGEESTAMAFEQNGYSAGFLKSFSIDTYGIVNGSYSNGRNKQLAQLAIATFPNPGGLKKSGETLYEYSNNSGDVQVGPAGAGELGTVAAGALEMSNVDLSKEFTDMIITQRGFQANSRIITTSDEMLQELVNLKR